MDGERIRVNHTFIDRGNAEKNPEMVKEFGIMQAPTLVITDGEHMTKYVNTSNIKKYVDEGL